MLLLYIHPYVYRFVGQRHLRAHGKIPVLGRRSVKIQVDRKQTNRSKKKPIFKYTSELGDFCCDTLARNRGLIAFLEWQALPALHGRPISLCNYNYCPWCGIAFEFEHIWKKNE